MYTTVTRTADCNHDSDVYCETCTVEEFQAETAEVEPIETVMLGEKGSRKAYDVVGRMHSPHPKGDHLIYLHRNGRYSIVHSKTETVRPNAHLWAIYRADVPQTMRDRVESH